MFADHPDTYVEFLGGRYRGKEGVRRLYQGRFQQTFVAGRNGPVRGFLLDHLMLQDIIDVDRTGTHAWCRMRALMQAGTHKSITDTHPRGAVQWWEGGLYENEYIKENGAWKLFRYRYFPFWHADFATGWQQTRENYIPWPTKTFPEDPLGPDELVDQKMLWPDTRVVPFHYPHPVTGERASEDDLRAPHYGQDAGTGDPLFRWLCRWARGDQARGRGMSRRFCRTWCRIERSELPLLDGSTGLVGCVSMYVRCRLYTECYIPQFLYAAVLM
ncbi:carotenoid oxygenase protein [Apiospora kogelbergensis]|uniref:Carotenoid oxygenase protein n=1 Tax=Apiospora kogelbergensis TaxID=1337665 RepID=A0AAW0QF15_9PEZI